MSRRNSSSEHWVTSNKPPLPAHAESPLSLIFLQTSHRPFPRNTRTIEHLSRCEEILRCGFPETVPSQQISNPILLSVSILLNDHPPQHLFFSGQNSPSFSRPVSVTPAIQLHRVGNCLNSINRSKKIMDSNLFSLEFLIILEKTAKFRQSVGR